VSSARCRFAAGLAAAVWIGGCASAPPPAPPPASAPPPAAVAPPSVRRQTVAVFPFANHGLAGHERLDFLQEWLPDSLAAALQSSGELRVVERRELVKILEEQKLGASALASKEGRLRLGKIAGAQTLVFGDFAAIGDVLQVNARIVDVETGVVLKSASSHGSVATARALGEEVSQRLARDLGITMARSAHASGLTDDRALTEAELFYQGLDLERQGQTDAAIERYRQALEIDPNDGEARARLRKLLAGSR
jgi:curli biogenesis system outer membrane secretion channel CsgG